MFRTVAGRVRTFRPDPARKLPANLYDIHHRCVYIEKTPDDGQRNCPKYVEFYSKNKFEKLVHLVCFSRRNYHDARSSECQIFPFCYTNFITDLISLHFSLRKKCIIRLKYFQINHKELTCYCITNNTF
jgi:hypothetical protein